MAVLITATVIVMVLLGLVLFVQAKKLSKKNWGALKGVGGMLVVIGFISAFGVWVLPDPIGSAIPWGGWAPAAAGVGVTPSVPVGGRVCEKQTDGTNTINFAVKDGFQIALEYLNVGVSFESADGRTIQTGTGTQGSTLTYTALNVEPCVEGTLYVLASTTVNSVKTAAHSYKLTDNVILESTNATILKYMIYDSTLTNDSNATAAQPSAQFSVAEAISSGGSYSFYVDLTTSLTEAKWGGPEGGVIGVDLTNLAKYSTSDGISINSETQGFVVTRMASCPADIVNNLDADVCFKVPQISSGITPVRLKVKITASLGDPGASDDVELWFQDKQYARDDDGSIFYGYYDASGTDVGVPIGLAKADIS